MPARRVRLLSADTGPTGLSRSVFRLGIEVPCCGQSQERSVINVKPLSCKTDPRPPHATKVRPPPPFPSDVVTYEPLPKSTRQLLLLFKASPYCCTDAKLYIKHCAQCGPPAGRQAGRQCVLCRCRVCSPAHCAHDRNGYNNPSVTSRFSNHPS
jgi:hypothetical protein